MNMTREAYEVLIENLVLPNKIIIKQELGNKDMVVHTKDVDLEHFINWIDKRTAINSIWDWTLRMIEASFTSYSKDKEVIKYYLSK